MVGVRTALASERNPGVTHELWDRTKASFVKHGGHPRGQGELEPESYAAPSITAGAPNAGRVMFVSEDRQHKMGHAMIYRIHKGPDATSATAILEDNPVSQQFYYIVVETPEGNHCRDIQGIYKE